MLQLHAYIHFNGRCGEAMHFYKRCLGARLNMQTAQESACGEAFNGAIKHRILHATLIKGDLLLMGSDMQGPDGYIKGNSISLSLNCSGEKELRMYFERLSKGGRTICPVTLQAWGALFGVVTDKFGITWMLNYDLHTQP